MVTIKYYIKWFVLSVALALAPYSEPTRGRVGLGHGTIELGVV